jgi:hypothetical protein
VLIYGGDKDGNRIPDPEEFTEHLIGDGDFRSDECIALLQEADIVVTNPPFSLFREYIAQLVKYNKKFLIIGNIGAVIYKDVWPLIKLGKMWMGHTSPKTFVLPDRTTQSFGNICWFTNIDTPKRHEDITLYRKYSRKLYPKYDNYSAIEVSRVVDIPMDYKGVMGVPISFLSKHNPDQFEILGFDRDSGIAEGNVFVRGRAMYMRIFIHNKRLETK